jgi:hypothetical protein
VIAGNYSTESPSRKGWAFCVRRQLLITTPTLLQETIGVWCTRGTQDYSFLNDQQSTVYAGPLQFIHEFASSLIARFTQVILLLPRHLPEGKQSEDT